MLETSFYLNAGQVALFYKCIRIHFDVPDSMDAGTSFIVGSLACLGHLRR